MSADLGKKFVIAILMELFWITKHNEILGIAFRRYDTKIWNASELYMIFFSFFFL